MTLFEQIYGTVTGDLLPEYCVPGVENAFAEGSLCDREYQQIVDARARIYERLQVTDEDEDMEIIFNSFLHIQNEIAEKIFSLGMDHNKFENRE